MHILFELEEQYGLGIDKVDNTYTLSFIQDYENKDSNGLKSSLNYWIRKRSKLQPAINDSSAAIEQKKHDYAMGKARYPYNFGE